MKNLSVYTMKPLGEQLLELGLLSPQQLQQALAIQKASPDKLLGQVLVDSGMLSTQEFETFMQSRIGIQQPLGELLIQKSYITREQLNAALSIQMQSGPAGKPLGQLLVEQGFITQALLDDIVQHQYRHQQMVRNNVFGTWACAEAAVAAKVESFVLISTDKAVRPTNVMGTTKRLAELTLQALAKRQHSTRFCMVRFGNVLGSSGSVVPLFRKQIKKGGPITLTHEDITRYFMTIPEAAQLVIQAGAMGEGGDVFVLDMGEPVRIYDLARKMVHLTGLEIKNKQNPQGDIEIKITGLRPGEKLYEELLIGENVRQTAHPRIMAADEVSLSWKEMAELLRQLEHHCDNFAVAQIVQLITEAPTGFNHSSPISDLVDIGHKTPDKVNDKNLSPVRPVFTPVAEVAAAVVRAS